MKYPARRDAGMITAELAAVLPVLLLVLCVAVSAVSVVAAQARLQDAAREYARAVARGDTGAGQRLADDIAPAAGFAVSSSSDAVTVVATQRVRLLGEVLPAVTITGRAVAAPEPGGGAAAQP